MPLLFSLCVHEFAHAWTARRLGDASSLNQERLTLSPAAHIDILGTLILPLVFLITNSSVFFGWAKPVPVDVDAFKNPRRDMSWVAFAGPLSNILLALAGTALLPAIYIAKTQGLGAAAGAAMAVEMFIFVNLLLAAFNLLPLHPLDGSQILSRFLPARWNMFLESSRQYSYILLILLIFTGGLYFLAAPVHAGAQSLVGLARGASVWLQGGL